MFMQQKIEKQKALKLKTWSDDNGIKEQWETCKHILVHSEIGNGTLRVFNFVTVSLNTHENFYLVYDIFKRAAKLVVAFGFVLKIVEECSCH